VKQFCTHHQLVEPITIENFRAIYDSLFQIGDALVQSFGVFWPASIGTRVRDGQHTRKWNIVGTELMLAMSPSVQQKGHLENPSWKIPNVRSSEENETGKMCTFLFIFAHHDAAV